MLLDIRNLRVRFGPRGPTVVDGVSFAVKEGETLALVGESGCGKTVTALSIPRLLPPSARVEADHMRLAGKELIGMRNDEMRSLRGKSVGVVFQDPMTSLNPVWSIGSHVSEPLRLHDGLSRRAAWEGAIDALEEVGIAEPKLRASEYPHQLSGGMRQRALIAAALACRPPLLIADEPTTALDVSVQAQILDLLLELREKRRLSILLITHDFGVVAEMAHRVAVVYAGQIVEEAGVRELFEKPMHPYTRALLGALPRLDRSPRCQRASLEPSSTQFTAHPNSAPSTAIRAAPPTSRRLNTIEGTVPDPAHFPEGCRFHPRCPHALEKCRQPQALREIEPGHFVRCGRAEELP